MRTARSNFKAHGKSPSLIYEPQKAKLQSFNYWFLVRVSSIFENTERMKKSVQLTLRSFNSRKAEQYFGQEGSPLTQHYINYRVLENSMRIC